MDEKKKVITPEILAKLKGMTAFSVEADFLYTPKVYRQKGTDGNFEIDKDFWPVFKLRSKNGLELADAEDHAGVYEVDPITGKLFNFTPRTGTDRITTLEKGLLGIKNLIMEDGLTILEFNAKSKYFVIGEKQKSYNGVKDIITFLPARLQTELQNAINERSTLTEEEEAGLQF